MRYLLLAALAVSIVSCRKHERFDPNFTITGPQLNKEILASTFNMANPGDSSELLFMDYQGNILRSLKTDGSAHNLQQWLINGKVRYSFNLIDKGGYVIPGIGYIQSSAVILDDSLKEIKRIQLLPHNDRTENDPNELDQHDFLLLGDDHYVAMSYYETQVNNIPDSLHAAAGTRVAAPIIQEVKNGQVIFEWNGSDYPQFYAQSVEGNNFSDGTRVHDYMHLNSISVDARDNHFICSFRNMDQVMKINRYTGDIIWQIGGKSPEFAMDENDKFLRQHDAKMIDGNTLLLFDNGEVNKRPYTRVMEYRLDEQSKKIVSVKATRVPGMFAQFMGSVQRIGDTYFIGGGSDPRIMELNRKTGEVLLEKKLSNTSYRAYKY